MVLFSKKSSVPGEIAKIIKARLILEGAHTMSKEILQITKEVTIQNLIKNHGLSETTAQKYYDEVLDELIQGSV